MTKEAIIGVIEMPQLGPDATRAYFSRSAANFDALYTEQGLNPLMRVINRRFRRDIYDRFILTMEHVGKHRLESVLDVGCGSGRYEIGLIGLGINRVMGIDFSLDMIDLAQHNCASLAHNGNATCEFVCCNFEDFQSVERFDLAVAMGVFDYVAAPRQFLQKMRKLVRHSVVVSFPSVSLIRTPVRKLRYRMKRCPVYFYSESTIRRLGEEAGFAGQDIRKIEGSGMDYFATFVV